MPATLEGLAGPTAAQGWPARAVTLTGAAAALRVMLGAPHAPIEREQIERWLGASRAALGDTEAVEAWTRGQAMTLEQAVAYALSEDTANE
jgi:hypothetical protein